MLRPSPRIGRDRRASPALVALAAATLGACNAIFGIETGEPTGGTSSGTGGKGGTGGSVSSSSVGGGGASSSSSSSTSSSGGAPPGCDVDAGTPTGTAEKLRITFAADAEIAYGAAFDAQGSAIVVGSFNGPKVNLGGGDLAHGPGTENDNVFVVKYGPARNHLWSKSFGGDHSVFPHAVAVAPNGDIWVTGVMSGTIQFGATPALVQATDGVNDYPDAFVVKLDASGEVIWAKRFGNTYIQAGVSVAVDAAGNGFVSGVGWDVYDVGKETLGQGNTWSSWIAKLDPSGDTQWSHAFLDFAYGADLSYNDYPESAVSVDPNGDVIVTSAFDGQAFFDGDPVASYGIDAYVLKLHGSTGAFAWKTFIGGGGDTDAGLDGDQWPTAIAADPCTGSVYVAGGFRERIAPAGLASAKVTIGAPSDADTFLVKLGAADGKPQWLRTFGDAGFQEARSLAVDHDGNVAFAGFFIDAAGYTGVDFGPPVGVLGPSPAPDPSDYEQDAFIMKLDAAGNTLWGKRIGDSALQRSQAVAVDAQGHVLVVGTVDGSLAAPPLAPLSSDYFDAFTLWLSP